MQVKRLGLLLLLLLFLLAKSVIANDYVVKPGDTVASIANWYAVDISEVLKLNGIKDPTLIRPGDVLIIPDVLIGNSRRKHEVKKGDNTTRIANRYKVSVNELRELNRISRGEILSIGRILAIPNIKGDPGPQPEKSSEETQIDLENLIWAGGVKGLVLSGRVTEEGVVHTVLSGQTIAMISRAYVLDGNKIARKNKITAKNPLKPGMEIIIPDAKVVYPVRTAQYKPHRLKLTRIQDTQTLNLVLIRPNSVLIPNSRNRVGRFLGYRAVRPRLVGLLQRVAERFPGHTLEIVSGFRKHNPKRRTRSYHSRNAAVDFRVQGVPNELIVEFVSKFDKVGVGYYPNSTHVHLDVRDRKYIWTDVSKRGQRARYVDSSHPLYPTNLEFN